MCNIKVITCLEEKRNGNKSFVCVEYGCKNVHKDVFHFIGGKYKNIIVLFRNGNVVTLCSRNSVEKLLELDE